MNKAVFDTKVKAVVSVKNFSRRYLFVDYLRRDTAVLYMKINFVFGR